MSAPPRSRTRRQGRLAECASVEEPSTADSHAASSTRPLRPDEEIARYREVQVVAVRPDPFTGMPVVTLEERGSAALFSLSVGLHEGAALTVAIEQLKLARPIAHDLLQRLIDRLGLRVEAVELDAVLRGTLYASIRLVADGAQPIALDARPSDALALALRTGAPVRVHECVLERLLGGRLLDAPDSPNAPGGDAQLLSPPPSGRGVAATQGVGATRPAGPRPPTRSGAAEAAQDRRGVTLAEEDLVDLGEEGLLTLLENLTDEEFGKWRM
jgi:bifunctional DNase/RNase